MCNNNRKLSMENCALHFLQSQGHNDLIARYKKLQAQKALGNISPEEAEHALFQYSLKKAGHWGAALQLYEDSAADTLDNTCQHIYLLYCRASKSSDDAQALAQADVLLSSLKKLCSTLFYNCSVLQAWSELSHLTNFAPDTSKVPNDELF